MLEKKAYSKILLLLTVSLAVIIAGGGSGYAATVSGTVFQSDGSTPLIGLQASVIIIQGDDDPCDAWNQIALGDTNSLTGTFTFTGLSAGTYYVLASATGYTSELWASPNSVGDFWECDSAQSFTVAAADTMSGVNFQLDPEATISGKIYEEDGSTPVSANSAVIYAIQGDSCAGWKGRGYWVDSTNGTYTLEGLPAGTYYLQATGNNSYYLSEWWADPASQRECSNAQTVTVDAGDTVAGKNFQLDIGGIISGTVFQDDGITPITGEDGYINVYEGSCGAMTYVTSGSIDSLTGTYTIGDLPVGTYYLQTQLSGGANYLDEWWAESNSTADCSSAQTVTVSASAELAGKDFQLSVGASISGTLFQEDGVTPIVGESGYVYVYQGDPCGIWTQYASGIIDSATGSYTAGGLPAGTYYLQTGIGGIDYLDEWWAEPNSDSDCSLAQSVTLSAGETVTAKDFQLDSAALDCSNAIPVTAGVSYSGDTTVGTSNTSSYQCFPGWDESGPEVFHSITTTDTGDLTATLSNLSADLEVFILDACNPNSCVAYGDMSATYADAPPGIYYIVVDGFAGASGTYTLDVADASIPTYTISGYIRDTEGTGIPWVWMNGLPDAPSTDSNGYYSGNVPEGWSGTVIPDVAGYSLEPASISYDTVSADQTEQNYTGSLLSDDSYEENDWIDSAWDPEVKWEATWLSNFDGLAYLSDYGDYYKIDVEAGTETVIIECQFTHADGNIDIGLYDADGNWLAGTWSDDDNESLQYTVPSSGTYYIGVYGEARGNTYDLWWDDVFLTSLSISGQIRTPDGIGIPGVNLEGFPTLPVEPVTDENGFYVASGTVLNGWSGTVTPQKDGYAFDPTDRTYIDLSAYEIDQDYVGYSVASGTVTISGYVEDSSGVGIPGVTFDGFPTLPFEPITDDSGFYIASGTVLSGWSGTVTPQKESYNFEPVSRTYNALTSVQAAQNYAGTLLLAAGLHQEDAEGLSYSGTWLPGNDIMYSNDAAADVIFHFSDTAFTLYRTLAANRGDMEVCVDGECQTVSNTEASTQSNQPVTIDGLSEETHTVTLSKSADDGSYIDLDAVYIGELDVCGTLLAEGRHEENDPDISFSSGWVQAGEIMYTNGASEEASFCFSGTEFTLYRTLAANRGSMDVCVDGEPCQSVSNTDTITQSNQPVTFDGFPEGQHSVIVTKTDADSSYIDLDAVYIGTPVFTCDAVLADGEHDNTDPDITYSAGWVTSGSLSYTNGDNETAVFCFDDTTVTIYRTMAINRASMEVCVDEDCETVSNFSSTTLTNQPYTRDGLSDGEHTVTIQKAEAGSSYIDLDALYIGPLSVCSGVLSAGWHEDSAAEITYTGSWGQTSSITYTNTVASTATFCFTGSGVTLYRTLAANRGDMELCVDGGCQTVSNYSASTQSTQPVTVEGLSFGEHTVTIQKSTDDGTYIDLDALEVSVCNGQLATGTAEETAAEISYTSDWVAAGSLMYTNDAEGVAGFCFSGTGVTIYRTLAANRGSLELCVDGVCETVDGYNASTLANQPYAVSGLEDGAHQVTLRKSADDGTYIDLSAVEIVADPCANPLGTGIYEEDADGISYTPGWATGSGIRYTNGSTDTASFCFSGTEVTIYRTLAANRGAMELCVDAVCETVSNTSSATLWRQPYTTSGLSSGEHTLTIQKAAADSSYIDLDAVGIGTVETEAVEAVVVIRKAGTGQGTIQAGEQVCGVGCEELIFVYGEQEEITVQVSPEEGSVFVGWQTEDGGSIEELFYANPGDTVYAVFDVE